MKKVLITGCSGFMGSHLIRYLSNLGYDTLGLDIRNPTYGDSIPEYCHCDILDLNKLRKVFEEYKPNIVVHLAARTDLNEEHNIEGYAANTTGTENLVSVVQETSSVERALFTSSQLVCRVGYIPKHDLDYQPNNLYGESKVLTEKIVRKSDLSSVSWCLLRPTTIWGEGMSQHYQRFLRLVKNGRFFHFGRRPLYKSYGYIGNAVHQYREFIEAPAEAINGNTFYIADYEPLELNEWINSLADAFGAKRPVTVPIAAARFGAKLGDLLNTLGLEEFPFNSFRLKNILTEYVFDLSATQEVCGDLPFLMEEGVKRTVAWFKEKES